MSCKKVLTERCKKLLTAACKNSLPCGGKFTLPRTGIYADEGISGTDTSHREAFNRMVSDCQNGRIDLILTKSISRFARNTLDCLRYIRLLKELHIAVVFEKESLNTMDEQGEVLITIMASIAQQESRSISDNVRMGIQYHFQHGKVRINHTHFLGYTKNAEGELIIQEDEAEIVRRIYTEFICGISMSRIAAGLMADKIPGPSGKSKWYVSTIKSILQNEKYMGDAVLQKYYTKDFLTKEQRVNDGVYPRYYIENDHEPIISRVMYERVQLILSERAEKKRINKNRYNYYYALSGRLICDQCGSFYYRINKNGNNKHSTWRCSKRMTKGHPCTGPILKESDLHRMIIIAFKNLSMSRQYYINRIHKLADTILPDMEEENDQIAEKIDSLMKEAKQVDYHAGRTVEDLEEEIAHEKRRKSELEKARLAFTSELNQLSRFMSYLDYYEERDPEKQNMNIEELYDEDMMRLVLEEVHVDMDHLSVKFCVGRTQTCIFDVSGSILRYIRCEMTPASSAQIAKW